jgi:transposase
MEIVRIGLDLAKYVFEVHAVDAREEVVLRKRLRREEVAAFFAEMPRCLVGMEACSSAHSWAKVLSDPGHEVRLMAPQFVTRYVKSNSEADRERRQWRVSPPNDRNDAEARLAKRSGARRCASCLGSRPTSWPCRQCTGSVSGWSPTGRGW